jgi:hypothetical protein
MKILNLLCLAAALLLAGCFRPSPGGLQGIWGSEATTPGTQSVTQEIIEYTFDGDTVVRVLEQRITSNDGTLTVTLRAEDSATVSVDESFSPPRIDLTNLQQLAAPTSVQFAVAANISGRTERNVAISFDLLAFSTFINKGLYQRNGDTLTLKFGTVTDYPADLTPPDVFVLDKQSKILGF